MINIKNFTYKDLLVNVNMTLNKEFNYIHGANGTGKSTLLDCISNLNQKYTGEISGNNSLVYLNQNLYFSYKLKFKDFVEFIFSLEGIKSYKTVYFEYAEKYGLSEEFGKNWNKRIGVLSGGERKKLYFSTICCLDRDWYLFDEPFSGVDTSGKEYMSNQFNNLVAMDKGVIITTHETEPLNNISFVKKHILEDSQHW